jgi:hypothetical protein
VRLRRSAGTVSRTPDQLGMTEQILILYAQYGKGKDAWLPPAHHIRALRTKGALLAGRGSYVRAAAAMSYEL